MKNTILAIALAAAGLAAIPAAHAADTSGFFINGNAGRSSLSDGAYNDNDTGFAGNIGYRWALTPSVLLGLEGGYTDLGSVTPTNGNAALGKAEIKGWNAGANAHVNVTDNWYVSGRAGLFRANLKGGYFGTGVLDAAGAISYPVVRVDDNSNKWYAGAGFGYDFNPNLSLGLNYDHYKADSSGLNFSPDLVSVSAEYRF